MNNTHRLKSTEKLLLLSQDVTLNTSDLIYPLFISESPKKSEALPGIPYYSISEASRECEKALKLGIPGIMVFDVTDRKDAKGTVVLEEDGFSSKLFRTLKKQFGKDLLLLANSGICAYREDGCCVDHTDGKVLVDETNSMIGKIAVAHASFGADMIVLPEMVDGQVRYAREALDANAFDHISIMSLVKGDTCLFNPFGKAMEKHSHEAVDPHTFRADPLDFVTFKRKIAIEVEEHVDIITIKPASLYLDLVRYVKDTYALPVGVFQVSGEYVMIKSAVDNGYFNEDEIMLESLSCMRRAGANMIMTYYALKAAKILRGVN